MKRSNWTFSYPASKVLEAAKGKHDYHTGRLKWWETQKDAVLAKIKAEGIEIDESVGGELAKFSNNYRQESVNIRTDLLTDMRECQGKIIEHRTKVADYDAWMQVLSTQGESSCALDQEDWLFFFGRRFFATESQKAAA